MSQSKSEELIKKLESNMPILPAPPAAVVEEKSKKEIQDDYEFSRQSYRGLVDKSNTAIESMLELAMQSEHPRAFEVLSAMLKNTSDITDKLLDLQKKKKDITTPTSEERNNLLIPTTQNNLFVGSTAELQRHFRNKLANEKHVDPEPEA